MRAEFDDGHALQSLIDEGWIAGVAFEVKSGKEATVFCCHGGPLAPDPLVAAKVYRPDDGGRFKHDTRYTAGRVHVARAGRIRRAVEAGSVFGRRVRAGTWLHHELTMLRALHDGGVRVPAPLACGDRAIVMEFLGDERGASPLLHETSPGAAEAGRIADALLDDIEQMLDLDCVHGDLSPYNVLLHAGGPVIIDLPQAVDPRLNPHGHALLARDVDAICRWAARHGASRPSDRITATLWRRFVEGEVG